MTKKLLLWNLCKSFPRAMVNMAWLKSHKPTKSAMPDKPIPRSQSTALMNSPYRLVANILIEMAMKKLLSSLLLKTSCK